MSGWPAYWNTDHDADEGLRLEALEYVRRLTSAIPLQPQMCVLDFGCGLGFVAEALAPRVRALYLWDANPMPLGRALQRVAGQRNAARLDLSTPAAPPSAPRFDLILVNSVVQYMPAEEFQSWLKRWAALLAEDGQLVLSDLISPDHRLAYDLFALLNFHPLIQIRRLGRDGLRNLGTRRSAPLLRVSREALRAGAAAAGLQVSFLPRNLTHFHRRYAAVLQRQTGRTLPAQAAAEAEAA